MATGLVLPDVRGKEPLAESELFTIKTHVLQRYHGPGGEVVVPDGVCAIGEEAFCDCVSPTDIVLHGWDPYNDHGDDLFGVMR